MGRAGDARRERASRPGTGSAHALASLPRRLAGPASLFSFRSIRQPLRAWAAALGLLAGLVLAAPAAAHQPLVGNFDQEASLTFDYGALDVAQAFTTGSNPNGYHFLGVQIQILDLASGMAANVATELPGSITEVSTLTTTATPGGGDVHFRGPANTQLAADTTYWVMIQGSSGEMRGTSSRAEDARSATGWSIANNRLVRTSGTTRPFAAVSGTDCGPIRMRVFGHVNSGKATSDKLHICYATGNWATKPTGLLASLDGNGLPALNWTAPIADAAPSAPEGYRPRRATDSGANSDNLLHSAGMTP